MSLKELSKKTFNQAGRTTHEEIQTGCLQRIADANEKMAVCTEKLCADYDQLKKDYECMRNRRDYWRDIAETKSRSLRATRGVVTRLKNKIKVISCN